MLDLVTHGKAILFLFTGVGVGLVGLYVVCYAAHCFLVVLDQTAWGIDRVTWPDEPVYDWLWKPVFLGWLVAFWVVPAWLLLGWLGPTLAAPLPQLTFGQLLLGTVWLLFPLSVLSALSSTSRWVVLRPALLLRLARHLGALLVVYVVGGAVSVGAALLAVHAALYQAALLPAAALAVAAAVLLYARLLGRLAWLVVYRSSPPAPRKAGKKHKKPKPPRCVAYDPWAVPEEEEAGPAEDAGPPPEPEVNDEWAPPTPYGLAKESAPPAARPTAPSPRRPAGEPVEAYRVTQAEKPTAPVPIPLDGFAPVGLSPLPPEPKAAREGRRSPVDSFEERLRAHRPPEEVPPAWPLVSGVYTFLFYPTTLRAWLYLAVLALVLGGLVRLAWICRPF